jgi:hypothetical protein
MWALAVGRWPSAAKTKALVNVLRDGDWDVELAVRSLPPASADSPRAAVVAAAEHRFMERQKSKYGAF